MSDKMIERVARAMEPRQFAILDKGQPPQSQYFEWRAFENAIKVSRAARKKARAAIAAMRVPTEAMVDAANDPTRANGSPMSKGAMDVWQSMIGVALEEP